MIRSLLVANRGEIARRIFRTARKMGIASIAVYSEPDRGSPFVREADSAVALGGASPSESYLRIEALIEAAKRAGAEAVHPGYGFGAENAAFAQAVLDAGLVWVGPPPSAIASMGSKLEAKRLVQSAGVPTLSSIDLTGMSDDAAVSTAEEIGYPVLVKASAGGGGKGMRIVRTPEHLLAEVESARREAASAFGDDTVFLERYLDAPRHIEIQVLADTHGNTISLYERECSIQRRYQKIVEEAPSVAVTPELRKLMGEAAVAAAESVGYEGAGTVEFLYQEGDFYFLEMNTRLQVEHPVTEEVTGLDLVEAQLLVAAGQPLPQRFLTPEIHGHAIEVRIYAEDATNDFLPVTGTLERFRFGEAPHIRLESGVEDASEISVHYDPLVAKVIAWAETRTVAAARLARALRRAEIHGSVTNRELLVRILEHPDFVAGNIDTHFLERHDPALLAGPLLDESSTQLAALAAALSASAERRATSNLLASIPSGWRNNPSQLQTTSFNTPHGQIDVGYRFLRRGGLETEINGSSRPDVVLHTLEPSRVGLEVSGHLHWFRIRRSETTSFVNTSEGQIRMQELPRFPSAQPDEEPGSLLAPMPGKVISVPVAEGESVSEGQVLVVMEAMKMEHTIRAPFAGLVKALRAAEGDQVEADAVLVVVEEP